MQQEETRQRIVAAAVDLHGTVGPARTTISAVAERAGVHRVTVYKHFPDERTLLFACTSHWQASHPPPDLDQWAGVADPQARLRAALVEIYTYYRENEAMLSNSMRDVRATPALAEALGPMFDYMERAVAILVESWGSGGEQSLLRGMIGHAADFSTWRSLVRKQGLTDHQAVEVMVRSVSSVVGAE